MGRTVAPGTVRIFDPREGAVALALALDDSEPPSVFRVLWNFKASHLAEIVVGRSKWMKTTTLEGWDPSP